MTKIPTERAIEIMSAGKILRALSLIEGAGRFQFYLNLMSGRTMQAVRDDRSNELVLIRESLRNSREEMIATGRLADLYIADALEGVLTLMILPVTVPV